MDILSSLILRIGLGKGTVVVIWSQMSPSQVQKIEKLVAGKLCTNTVSTRSWHYFYGVFSYVYYTIQKRRM